MLVHLFIDPAPPLDSNPPPPLILIFLLPSRLPASLAIHRFRMRNVRADASGIYKVGVLRSAKIVREQAAVESRRCAHTRCTTLCLFQCQGIPAFEAVTACVGVVHALIGFGSDAHELDEFA